MQANHKCTIAVNGYKQKHGVTFLALQYAFDSVPSLTTCFNDHPTFILNGSKLVKRRNKQKSTNTSHVPAAAAYVRIPQ